MWEYIYRKANVTTTFVHCPLSLVFYCLPNLWFCSFDLTSQLLILQCDGQYIPLPSLQGIAVLNIPSYAGGTNFWGGTKEDDVSIPLLCLEVAHIPWHEVPPSVSIADGGG